MKKLLRVKLRHCLVSIIIFASVAALAEAADPSANLTYQLHVTNSEISSLAKTPQILLDRLKNRRAALVQIITQGLQKKDASPEKIDKELAKEELLVELSGTIASLDQAIVANISHPEMVREVHRALLVEKSMGFEGHLPGIEKAMRVAQALLLTWSIYKDAGAEKESRNLVDPESNRILNRSEIQTVIDQGGDISKYHPVPQSPFWQEPNVGIPNVSMEKAALGRYSPLYNQTHIWFPKDRVYYYNKVKTSQTKPKLNVYAYDDQGKKSKFKLKLGAELHSDPTSSAFMMALGFPTDVTRFQKNIKLVFKKGSLNKMIRDWEEYFKRESVQPYKVEDFIVETGTTPEGYQYIVLNDVLVQSKPDNIERLGPWGFSDLDHNSYREVRALMLVQIWLANGDVKDFENNKIVQNLKNSKGKDLFLTHSDPGLSMGHLFPEKANIFKANLVRRETSNRIDLNFISLQKASVRKHITDNDARWATRLIAQLTRDQIRDGVKQGSWPQCVQKIYTEKLISRRNSLVRALELSDEIAEISVRDKWIDGKQVSDCLKGDNNSKEFHTDFRFSANDIMDPAAILAKSAVISGMQAGVNAFERIHLGQREHGIDHGLVAQVIVDYNREVVKNDKHKDYQEQYLVEDSVTLGFRLGYSFGVFSDRMVAKKYTLVYPVRSKDEGRIARGFVADLLLPVHLRKGQIPAKFVMRVEHYVDWRFGIHLDEGAGPVSPGLKLGHANVFLWGMVIDGKEKGEFKVMRYRSKYMERFLDLYLRAYFVRFHFVTAAHRWGKEAAYLSRVPRLPESYDSIMDQSLRAAALKGDISALEANETGIDALDLFDKKETNINLLFHNRRRIHRSDSITVSGRDTNLSYDQEYQYRRAQTWKFGYGETRTGSVKGLRTFDESTGKLEMMVDLELEVYDKATKSKEMSEDYFHFANSLPPGNRELFPNFNNLDWSRNARWGRTVTALDIEIYDSGIDKLMALTPEQFDTNLELELKDSSKEAKSGIRKRAKRVRRLLSEARKDPSGSVQQLKRVVKLVGLALYKKTGGMFLSDVLAGLLRGLNDRDVYLSVEIKSPIDQELNWSGEIEPYGEWGVRRKFPLQFIVYEFIEPNDLYRFMDAWPI